MTTLEGWTVADSCVEGGIGWVTPSCSERAEFDVVRCQLLDAVADHARNPDVHAIVISELPPGVMNGPPHRNPKLDDEERAELWRQINDVVWKASKTIVLRRSWDRSTSSEDSDVPVYVEPLTERERQVLSMACQGASARAIGAQLYISERTVESHVARIYRKLGIRSRFELMRRAAEFGL